MTVSPLRRRLRVLAGLLRSPSDLGLLVRMAAWALVLPILKFVVPLPRLVRLVSPSRRGGRHGSSERVERLASIVYGRRGLRPSDNCLERSLVTFRYLSASGAEPRLVVGMRSGSERIVGHAWVTVDGRPLHDSPAFLEGLVTVLTFAADGSAVEP